MELVCEKKEEMLMVGLGVGVKCRSGDLRNTMWRWKGSLEPPEPRLRLKQERCVDKPPLGGLRRGFQQSAGLNRAAAPTPLRMLALPIARPIADYVHCCLPLLCQTGINPHGVFTHLIENKSMHIFSISRDKW